MIKKIVSILHHNNIQNMSRKMQHIETVKWFTLNPSDAIRGACYAAA